MADRLLTVNEVSERLGALSVDDVRYLLKKGFIKYMKLGHLKVREKSLDDFLEDYDGMDFASIQQARVNKEEIQVSKNASYKETKGYGCEKQKDGGLKLER